MANNRKSRNPARACAIAGLVFLAAAALIADSALGSGERGDRQGRRRQVIRENLIRSMDVFAVSYGAADWSAVVSSLEANPSDPANTAFMSVPLSLANVYLNRYEVGGGKDALERSVGLAEWVVWNRGLWAGREGSGSVVAYLDITARRLQKECDIGGFEDRIAALWQAAMEITAGEADAITGSAGPCGPTLLLQACLQSILPYPEEEQARASRAALLAAASSFLSSDPRAQTWARSAGQYAQSIPATACPEVETEIVLSQGALTFLLAGGDAPAGFEAGSIVAGKSSVSCPRSDFGFETGGPVDVVEPGETLAAAIQDSRVVAFLLTERFLARVPPGSQCEAGPGE